MIDRAQWERLSGLLDEALALEPDSLDAWMEDLAAREPDLALQIKRMLAQGNAEDTSSQTAAPEFGQWLASALDESEAETSADLRGMQLGAWALEEKIGEGGMGQVWRASRADGLYQGQAAIKLLRGDLPAESLAGRFARERAVLARLNHPAIAHLLDAGISNGHAFLVLELVEGLPLTTYLRAHCPTVSERVALLRQIAEAVDYAHAHLIVHRDLKPSNVMVTADGQPKLLDFGVAALLDDDGSNTGDLTRQTGRGVTVGYAAPEQITGGTIGTAADVFSLGVMLFEMLSGGLPFGKRGTSRALLEQAVLGDDPARLPEAFDDPQGPGRPVDASQVRGDLEAIVAKALRKDAALRYGSARALINDLANWQGHRPVSARRENWRHNMRLWLRRNAILTTSVAIVTAALSVGLAASVWQWHRAEQAARESNEITEYLQDLLASSSPDRHGGEWPTVLQLLDRSREEIPDRFGDSPDMRLRVLGVMARTYRELNRHDIALPMLAEAVTLSAQRYGEDDRRTLQARLEQARNLSLLGQDDVVIASLEPALPRIRRTFGAHDEELLIALTQLNTCYSHLGRLEDADRVLSEAGRIVETMPADNFWHASYLNHLDVLRVAQGRLQDALTAVKQTQRFWNRTEPENQREILTLQRNTIAIQIRVAEYDHIEERSIALLEKIDRLLNKGSGLALSLRTELARYYLESGQWTKARLQREDNIAYAHAAGVNHLSSDLPMSAQALLVQAQTHAISNASYLRRAKSLLEDTNKHLPELGQQRAEIWLAVARGALALDEGETAASVLKTMQADAGLQWDRNLLLTARKRQLDGELARWRGDLVASRVLLNQRMDTFRHMTEKQTVPGWSAALDLAYTLILQADPGAVDALRDAHARRPASVPAGHPLDAVEVYLAIRQKTGRDDVPGARLALAAVARATTGAAVGEKAGEKAGSIEPPMSESGRASLFGALF